MTLRSGILAAMLLAAFIHESCRLLEKSAEKRTGKNAMKNKIEIVPNTIKEKDPGLLAPYSPEASAAVRKFHKSFPEYAPTPLAELKELAASLKVRSIHVKDESCRFGLNAFKVLGGSFCIGKYIADRLGTDISQVGYDTLTSPDTRARLGEVHFVTATDGNHGRGIAWTAKCIAQPCTVYMPRGTAAERLENIRALGADASIIEGNYDDAVRLSLQKQSTEGWVMVQDTTQPGYEKIPAHIMQGYTTMAGEALEQLQGTVPSHIFLQAGVGSMAAAVAAFFAAAYPGDKKPLITIVEPTAADCFLRTARAADGKIHIVEGDMNTMMAGLACGEPCTLAWDILKGYADFFVSIPDELAAKGMRVLGRPMGADPRVVSGESGASCFGFVYEVLKNPELKEYRDMLGLNEDSRILCFSTEGDTDRENYRKILGE